MTPAREASAFTALLQRDLRIALRRRADTGSALVFFVIVTSLFPLGVGPQFERADLERLKPGVDEAFGVKSLVARYIP